LGLLSLDGQHRDSVIYSPAVLWGLIHIIANGSMEGMEEHLFWRVENIAPTRACSISFEDASFGGFDGAMHIFTVTTVNTTNPCFTCSVYMPWALYVCMTF
jgi:hypothetical protein